MNRRGEHPLMFVLGFVGLVAVILIALALILAFNDTTSSIEKDAPCATAILAHSTVLRTTGGMAKLPITCATDYKTVAAANDDDANREIAEAMKRCWSVWGRGQIQLFGDKEAVYCHVCSVITVDGLSTVKGLPAYLDTHTIKGNLTYAQYLTGEKSGAVYVQASFPQAAQSSFDTKKPIGVIFYYAKGQTNAGRAWNTFAVGTAGAIGLGTGFVAGAVAALPLAVLLLPVSPLVLAGGGASGGVTGLIAGTAVGKTLTIDMSEMSAVTARPLDAANLTELGCGYSPAKG